MGNLHSSTKQFVYFTNLDDLKNCKDDIIPILLTTSSYSAHNLNFVTCFLNNTPPKQQQFILHWGNKRIPNEACRQDVFEIVTTYYTQRGEEHEKRYFIPAVVLFTILNISIPYDSMLNDNEGPKDPCITSGELAIERSKIYNQLLGKYCMRHQIAFHPLDYLRKKDTSYIMKMRKL